MRRRGKYKEKANRRRHESVAAQLAVQVAVCPHNPSQPVPCIVRDGNLAVTDGGRCAGCDRTFQMIKEGVTE